MPYKEFSLSEHLRKKSCHEKRVAIPLQKYDEVIAKIISAIQKTIISPTNDTGFTDVVIFGSWARRDDKTGPTANSDLDLLAYKPTSSDIMDVVRFESLIQSYINPEDLSEEDIHISETTVWSELHGDDLSDIRNGNGSIVTKDGYIIVSAETYFSKENEKKR